MIIDDGRQWQPIETAPKDGTTVLLWWRSEYGDIAYWACATWEVFSDGSGGWVGESFHATEPKTWMRLIGEKPTHWMPLPPQPGGLIPVEKNEK